MPPGPLPALPTPNYDWSVFPALELPSVDCRRFQSEHGDDLYVRNLHETLRMAYTIYEAVMDEPEAWRDGKPLATVETIIPPEYEAYTAKFWPWRESEDAVCQGYLRKTRFSAMKLSFFSQCKVKMEQFVYCLLNRYFFYTIVF